MYVHISVLFSQDRVAPTTPACLNVTFSNVLGPWNSVTTQTICHQVLLLNPFIINLRENTCLHVYSSCTLAYMFTLVEWYAYYHISSFTLIKFLKQFSLCGHACLHIYFSRVACLSSWIISSVTSLSRNELHNILTNFPTQFSGACAIYGILCILQTHMSLSGYACLHRTARLPSHRTCIF